MNQHRARPFLLYVIALLVFGAVAWWIVGVLVGILFKLALVAVLVAGALYLLRRPADRLGRKGHRPLRR